MRDSRRRPLPPSFASTLQCLTSGLRRVRQCLGSRKDLLPPSLLLLRDGLVFPLPPSLRRPSL